METNRIDYSFSLAGKNTTTKSTDGNGGFANMLFDAMNKRSDLAMELAQIKAAPSGTTQPVAPQRRFDDRPRDAMFLDDRSVTMSPNDRGSEQGQMAAKYRPDSDAVAKVGPGADDRVGNLIRSEKKQESGTKIGCGDQQMAEAGGGDAIESGTPVDVATEADLSDGGQELALGAEGSEGEVGTGTGNDDADPQADLLAVLALTIDTAADESVAVADVDIALTSAPVAAATAATPAAEIDPAAVRAAAAILPDIDGIAATDEDAALPLASSAATPSSQNGAPTEAKPAVTFAATMALAEASDLDAADAQIQTAAIAADNERQLEDSGSPFRRNLGNGRKATPISQGPTAGAAQNYGAPTNTSSSTPNLHVAAAANTVTGSTTAPTGLAPAGFDTGLGPSPGLPGWNLHLAQGASVRRGDFVANLRQHLQNLPVHDQVALSIQRSVRDGGGSITLQLSPTELGRIHLKLNIDEENNVQASVMVERPATLELLQRDMKALERALQEAGLKAGPGDLSFSLQGGDPEAFARDFGSGNGSGSGGNGLAKDEGGTELPAGAPAAVIATGDGLVDVQV